MDKKLDEIDKLLYLHFRNNNMVPYSVTKTIKTTDLNKTKQTYNFSIKKLISIIIAFLTISGGIVFASVFISNMFIYNRGIEKAVENNYIQNINMDYTYVDNLSFKVDYFVMDDINLNIVFEFKSESDNILKDYQGVSFNNLKIYDDLGNQILYDTEGDEFYNNIALIHSSWQIIEKDDYHIRQILKAQSQNFPNSNTIFVEFDGITLYTVENGLATTKEYTGNWILKFDISEQLHDRKVQYFLSDNKDFEEIKLSNTGLVIKLKSNTYPKNISLYDDKNNKYNIILTTQNRSSVLKKYISDEWIMFFDASIYNDIEYFKININNLEYILKKSNI